MSICHHTVPLFRANSAPYKAIKTDGMERENLVTILFLVSALHVMAALRVKEREE